MFNKTSSSPGGEVTPKVEQFKRIGKYIISLNDLLGMGRFGTVYMAHDEEKNKKVAAKLIRNNLINNGSDSESLKIKLSNEVSNMQKLNHPNIVKFIDLKRTSNFIYIIMEYCNGDTLQSYLKKHGGHLSEQESIKLIKQILDGFRCLYQNNIVHRDLKTSNILLHDGQIKIADFGFSKLVEHSMKDQKLMSIVRTPFYMSPQILRGEPYSSKTDIWSLGIIFYEMLIGKKPWSGTTTYNLLMTILDNPLQFPIDAAINKNCANIIRKMLTVEEEGRIDWDELLSYELFKELDIETLRKSFEDIESNFWNNKLIKAIYINELYFLPKRVIKNHWEMITQMRLEDLMNTLKEIDMPLAQSPTIDRNVSPVTSNKSEKELVGSEKGDIRMEKIFKEQRIESINDETKSKIADWVLFKRNRTILLNRLAVYFHYSVFTKKISISSELYSRFLFILLKYQMMTMFKLLTKIKSKKCDKYSKFTKEEWDIFVNDEKSFDFFVFLKDDFTVIKMFFLEFLEIFKGTLPKLLDSPNNTLEQREKLKKIVAICDNNLSDKNSFQNIFSETVEDFYLESKRILEKEPMLKNDKEFLIFCCHLKHTRKYKKILNFKEQEAFDFNKYYERYEKKDTIQLLNNFLESEI